MTNGGENRGQTNGPVEHADKKMVKEQQHMENIMKHCGPLKERAKAKAKAAKAAKEFVTAVEVQIITSRIARRTSTKVKEKAAKAQVKVIGLIHRQDTATSRTSTKEVCRGVRGVRRAVRKEVKAMEEKDPEVVVGNVEVHTTLTPVPALATGTGKLGCLQR